MSNFGTFNPIICTNSVQGYSIIDGTSNVILTASSDQQQTAITSQPIILPVTSTLALGMTYTIMNKSPQSIIIQSSGGDTVTTLNPTLTITLTCISLSGTTAASWSIKEPSITITGTANQITASASIGAVTLSLPTSIITNSLILNGLIANQSVVTNASKLLTSSAYTSAPVASVIISRDNSGNSQFNNILQGYATTATAGGTTILTVASKQQQYFTGTNTQTVVLPDTSTLTLGHSFTIFNRSIGLVTVRSSNGDVISILGFESTGTLTCISTNETTAASWSGGNIGTFLIGENSTDICFDGTNIWVTNTDTNSVTKFLAVSGMVEGVFTVGLSPVSICFDGINIWSSNYGSANVTKILASTGDLMGTFSVGTNPQSICFDGTNIWVANFTSDNVTKLLAATGALIGTYGVGIGPQSVCFDGTNIWVANSGSANVTKLLASNGNSLGTYSVGTSPRDICFDGTNVWIANFTSNNVTKLLASTGDLIGTYAVGTEPCSVCFDGTNIWVTNFSSHNITKLLSSDGSFIATFIVDLNPRNICFDGTNIWTTNTGSLNINKITQPYVQSATIGVPLLSTFDNISRDIYANTRINNLIDGCTFTVTSAGTTSLSVISSQQQYFTGTNNHTVILPNVTTLSLGQTFKFVNRSTGIISINSFGGNLLVSLSSLYWGWATCISLTGNTASSWSYEPEGQL